MRYCVQDALSAGCVSATAGCRKRSRYTRPAISRKLRRGKLSSGAIQFQSSHTSGMNGVAMMSVERMTMRPMVNQLASHLGVMTFISYAPTAQSTHRRCGRERYCTSGYWLVCAHQHQQHSVHQYTFTFLQIFRILFFYSSSSFFCRKIGS